MCWRSWSAATPDRSSDPYPGLGSWTICAECHGSDLHGASNPDFTSPSLEIVAAYSPEAFTQLLRTGLPLGGRTLPVMGPRSRESLSQLTDAEIAALYGYLHTMPQAAHH